jgi:hypothetical protein
MHHKKYTHFVFTSKLFRRDLPELCTLMKLTSRTKKKKQKIVEPPPMPQLQHQAPAFAPKFPTLLLVPMIAVPVPAPQVVYISKMQSPQRLCPPSYTERSYPPPPPHFHQLKNPHSQVVAPHHPPPNLRGLNQPPPNIYQQQASPQERKRKASKVKYQKPKTNPASNGIEAVKADYQQQAEAAVAMMGLSQCPFTYKDNKFSN